MNRVILVIIFLLVFIGCTKKKDLTQESASVAAIQEANQIESVQTVTPSKTAEIVKQQAGVAEETQAMVKDAQQQKALVEPVVGAEEIIAQNRWGFSVYDPQTEIEEFYTSPGVLLGSKKRQ